MSICVIYVYVQLRYSGKVDQKEVPSAIPKEIIRQIPFKKHSLILFVCDAMDLPVLLMRQTYAQGSIIPHLNELVRNKPMLIVVNKMDLLPVDTSTPQMKRWIYSLFKAHNITVDGISQSSSVEYQGCIFRECTE